MRTEQTRTATVAIEIAYTAVTCDKCGVEWAPPQPERFESEREYAAWRRQRDVMGNQFGPTGWFSLAGPNGDAECVRHFCPACVAPLLEVAK